MIIPFDLDEHVDGYKFIDLSNGVLIISNNNWDLESFVTFIETFESTNKIVLFTDKESGKRCIGEGSKLSLNEENNTALGIYLKRYDKIEDVIFRGGDLI